jgi:hypothetical protein
MNYRTIIGVGLLLGLAAFAPAQTQTDSKPQLGRGRGGAPYAWNDKDRDGICDITGRPVGTGWRAAWRAQDAGDDGAALRGRGRGGAPYAWNDKDRDGICDITGRPVGAGYGRGRGWRSARPAQQSAGAQTQPQAQP